MKNDGMVCNVTSAETAFTFFTFAVDSLRPVPYHVRTVIAGHCNNGGSAPESLVWESG